MCRFFLYILFIALVPATAGANTFIELADEATLPIPEGWTLTETAEYPFQFVNDDSTAELLVFKSVIDENETVSNDQELKLSVDKVIEDVILTLPESQLLTNTGYFENNRVSFALEFLSTDTTQDLRLMHRLKGVIYTHPDGYQILFSLWGKAALGAPNTVMDNLRAMQDGFKYVGDARRSVFGNTYRTDWVWIAILLMLLAILLMLFRRRRSPAGAGMSSNPERFWKCECGRLNSDELQTCSRCGKAAGTPIIP